MADDTATPTGEPVEADEAEATEPKIHPAGAVTEVAAVATDEVETADTDAVDADAVDAEAAEGDEAVEDDDVDADDDVAPKPRMSHLRLATIFGLIALLAVSGLAGWQGYRAYESHRSDTARNEFLAKGKQVVTDLTTIDVEHVDEQTQRILDSATGTFYDDFERRAQPFAQVVKELKSKTDGTINEAGVESLSDTDAVVLVAVTVKTSIAAQPDQPIRAFRMRISVQKIGDDVKVSEVKYVS